MTETILDRSTAKSMALGITLQLIAGYCLIIGVWGFALNKSIILFVIAGFVVGLLIGIFNSVIILNQKTVERANDMMFSMGSLWGGLGAIIGIVGLVYGIIRILFFR